jgi:hypothetical protein
LLIGREVAEDFDLLGRRRLSACGKTLQKGENQQPDPRNQSAPLYVNGSLHAWS